MSVGLFPTGELDQVSDLLDHPGKNACLSLGFDDMIVPSLSPLTRLASRFDAAGQTLQVH